MPTPAKTTNEDVVAAARTLLEVEGPDFPLARLAEALGIRAPSLYKRFQDRAAILAAVQLAAIKDLGATVARAMKRDPDAPLLAAARAYRRFAAKHTRAYALIFTSSGEETEELQNARASSVAPLLAYLETQLEKPRALPAARLLTAYLHGFVSMEQAGAFHLGGSVDDAFDAGLDAILKGLELSECSST